MPVKSWSDIFEAVTHGDKDAVVDFVENENVPPTTLSSRNETVLHVAVRSNDINIVKYLLEKDRSLWKVRDGYNYNVLHRATERGFVDIIRFLVDECKADLNVRVNEIYGNTVLHIAAGVGKLEALKYFIEEKHMDANVRNHYGQPPAFSAAAYKQLDVIKYLAEERKVDLTVLDMKNENILFTSVMRRDIKVPRYLLDDRKLNLDVNWRGEAGRTVVFWAARISATYFIRYFVKNKGADVNIADNDGLTPLHQAAQYNHLRTAKVLIKHNANLRAVDKFGREPVDLATDLNTIRYFDMLIRMKDRHRRSVSNESFSILQTRIPCKTMGRILSQDAAVLRISHRSRYTVVDARSYGEISVPHLNSFLTLVVVVLHYLHR